MHAKLRNTRIDGSDTRMSAQHRSNSSATSTIVPDLESLQFSSAGIALNTLLQDRGRDRISRHVCIAIEGNGWPNIETWRVVLKIHIEKVGINGVAYVAADKEGVGVCSGDEASDALIGELINDALDNRREEVATGALTEE
jgi:hypothetical protein